MSGLRRVTAAAGLVLAAALVAVAVALAGPGAAPARAAQVEVFLELRPNTIQAGFQVSIEASCGGDLNPATVQSPAFGEITLNPLPNTGLLTGAATVPATTQPGEYRVELRCVDGATATAQLFVLDMHRPTRGPDTGGGGAAGTAGIGAVAVLLAGGGVVALGAGAGLLLRSRRPG